MPTSLIVRADPASDQDLLICTHDADDNSMSSERRLTPGQEVVVYVSAEQYVKVTETKPRSKNAVT